MDDEFDLAIIGGGIIGMCTAWYAAQQYPQWRIAVFEQNVVGSGATHYSASLNLPYGHTPLRHRLASRSHELYASLRKKLSLPIKDLSFYGIADIENTEKIISNLVYETQKVSPEIISELSGKYPGLIIPDDKTVVAAGTASYAMQNVIAKIIGDDFCNQHHIVFENTTIQSIELISKRYKLLAKSDKIISAQRVVQATGPWQRKLLINETPPTQTIRIKKVVAFHILQQPKSDDALFYFFDDDAFLLPKYESGYWLFSFKCDHWDVLPEPDHLNIDDADIAKARSILNRYYPSFVPLCNEGRVFCDAYSETGDPVIQPFDSGNYVFAGAGSGSGYRLGPAIAEAAINHLVMPV